MIEVEYGHSCSFLPAMGHGADRVSLFPDPHAPYRVGKGAAVPILLLYCHVACPCNFMVVYWIVSVAGVGYGMLCHSKVWVSSEIITDEEETSISSSLLAGYIPCLFLDLVSILLISILSSLLPCNSIHQVYSMVVAIPASKIP